MKTRCPQCHKLYQLDSDLLDSSCSQLICGQCQTIFDVKKQRSQIDQIWGEISESRAKKDVPTENQVDDKEDPVSALDFGLSMFKEDIPEDMRHLKAKEVPSELLQIEEEESPIQRFSPPAFFLFILLSLLALIQLAVIYRQPLSQYAEFDAIQDQICQYFKCRLKLESSRLEPESDHYRLYLSLFNPNDRDRFPPSIVLTLLDEKNHPVARRLFKLEQSKIIPARHIVDFELKLNIDTPFQHYQVRLIE